MKLTVTEYVKLIMVISIPWLPPTLLYLYDCDAFHFPKLIGVFMLIILYFIYYSLTHMVFLLSEELK